VKQIQVPALREQGAGSLPKEQSAALYASLLRRQCSDVGPGQSRALPDCGASSHYAAATEDIAPRAATVL
jgi:hypothetical protein